MTKSWLSLKFHEHVILTYWLIFFGNTSQPVIMSLLQGKNTRQQLNAIYFKYLNTRTAFLTIVNDNIFLVGGLASFKVKADQFISQQNMTTQRSGSNTHP